MTVSVLVVEDVPVLSRLLEMSLDLDGRFESLGVADSGVIALDLAVRLQPDAVVLDLNIDGVGGLGVLPSLRRVLPEAHIIVFTANDDIDLRARAIDAGASGWVRKGSELGYLLDELAAIGPEDDQSEAAEG